MFLPQIQNSASHHVMELSENGWGYPGTHYNYNSSIQK